MLIVSFVRSDDMVKGRRIEIEYQNGLWCAKTSTSVLPPAPIGGFCYRQRDRARGELYEDVRHIIDLS
jgi:hypothetical protein